MSLAYDICRCAASQCPVKDTCQRFTDKAIGGYWVSWSDFSINLEGKPCQWLIPLDPPQPKPESACIPPVNGLYWLHGRSN